MGYSYAAKAGYALDKLSELIASPMSNGMPDGGFYEHGRENDDGAITGTVWRKLNAAERGHYAHLSDVADRVVRRGSFRINPDGTIKRFPGLPSSMLREAERLGAALYVERHMPQPWRKVALILADQLAADRPSQGGGSMRARAYWRNVEALAADYQRETKTAFLALPACECRAMAEFLRSIASTKIA